MPWPRQTTRTAETQTSTSPGDSHHSCPTLAKTTCEQYCSYIRHIFFDFQTFLFRHSRLSGNPRAVGKSVATYPLRTACLGRSSFALQLIESADTEISEWTNRSVPVWSKGGSPDGRPTETTHPRVYLNAFTTASVNVTPFGEPRPVTLSQPGPVDSDVPVWNVNTSQRVDEGYEM